MSEQYAGDGTVGDSQDGHPLRPALSAGRNNLTEEQHSPRTGPTKAVSIAEPESTSPLQPLDDHPHRQFSAGIARRLTGRPPLNAAQSSRNSLVSQTSMDDLPASHMKPNQQSEGQRQSHHHHHHERLLKQVSSWLQSEKGKRAARKSRKNNGHVVSTPDPSSEAILPRPRGGSLSSNASDISLDKLQKILDESLTSFGDEQVPYGNHENRSSWFSHAARRRSSTRKLSRTASSDTDYQDGDVIVPSCDAILDNSKTLSYSGGAVVSTTDPASSNSHAEKERKAWSSFKGEILRLAHTLRLKGWRRIPLDRGDDIQIERLSGALTNAVYVVSPPENIREPATSTGSGSVRRISPPKLLLRIYGPQVEHLIDREIELSILRRLARKKIGPRLLGTFQNGRFEQYFASKTLTYDDLRNPETSKQIAKRMRELHDGVELLEQERDDGPFVWLNWDKWVDRCERVISYLDDQILSVNAGNSSAKVGAWKERGLICGVEWPIFRKMVERYRQFLTEHYGGAGKLRDELVFAHNDTQYGNILRLVPSGESPLLLPANSHKQLIVIDFEYASANTPGLEFANHFTEWCYNYHDPVTPYACKTTHYPNPEEQRRFIRSYVNHNPQSASKASTVRKAPASTGLGSRISTFMLDSRNPSGPSSSYIEEEEQRLQTTEAEVERLILETRIWRVANTAQWVAWGIVQAKVPEVDDLENACASTETSPDGTPRPMLDSQKLSEKVVDTQVSRDHDKRPEGFVAEVMKSDGDATKAREVEGEGGEEEFDYLAYARDRAMFFWGDVVNLGLCSLDELPQSLRDEIKIVKY